MQCCLLLVPEKVGRGSNNLTSILGIVTISGELGILKISPFFRRKLIVTSSFTEFIHNTFQHKTFFFLLFQI